MKAMKFKVRNPEHSEAIQKRLFELGYKWMDGSKTIQNKAGEYLYANADGGIAVGLYASCFRDDDNKETTLDELYEMPTTKTVMIRGVDEDGRNLFYDVEIRKDSAYHEEFGEISLRDLYDLTDGMNWRSGNGWKHRIEVIKQYKIGYTTFPKSEIQKISKAITAQSRRNHDTP